MTLRKLESHHSPSPWEQIISWKAMEWSGGRGQGRPQLLPVAQILPAVRTCYGAFENSPCLSFFICKWRCTIVHQEG